MEDITINKGMIERIRNKAYYERVVELMRKDSRICYVACDGLPEGSVIRNAMQEFPDRIVDVGIAEQNLIGVGAGLAMSGKRPLLESMSSFMTLRALDQIHIDLAYNDVAVRLLGKNNGTSGGSGPTHDAICDIALINSIPNMAVIVPADMEQYWQALYSTLEYEHPIYFRMPRFEDEIVYKNKEKCFSLGKANILRKGKDLTIITTGKCVSYALKAAECLSKEGLEIGVVDMCTIKPIDRKTIVQVTKETERILTVEDHNTLGGLGTLVASVIAESGISCQFYKLGIPDEFSIFGPREKICEHYCFDTKGIINIIKTKFTYGGK